MKFEHALVHLKEGKKIKRSGWETHWHKDLFHAQTMVEFYLLNTDDWEVIEEPKPTKISVRAIVTYEIKDIERDNTIRSERADSIILEVMPGESIKHTIYLGHDFTNNQILTSSTLERNV